MKIKVNKTWNLFESSTRMISPISDKKEIFSIGTYHLNELFKEEKTSMSGYIKLSIRF